jgi:hypothetical protein
VDAARRHTRGERPAVLHVALEQVVGIPGPAQRRVRRATELLRPPDEVLELVLDPVVELQALGIKHLQAVVVGRVVGRRHHDSRLERPGCRHEGQRRRRHDPHDVNVAAEARGAGGQRGHEHVAAAPSVLADGEGAARPDQLARRRPAERVGERGLQVDIRDAADSVRAEQAGQVGSFPEWWWRRSVRATAWRLPEERRRRAAQPSR